MASPFVLAPHAILADGEYHADWRNQLIHIFFVPCLVWSGMVFLVHTGPLTTIPMVSDTVEVNGAFVAALLYMSYYLYLDFWPAVSARTEGGVARPAGLSLTFASGFSWVSTPSSPSCCPSPTRSWTRTAARRGSMHWRCTFSAGGRKSTQGTRFSRVRQLFLFFATRVMFVV